MIRKLSILLPYLSAYGILWRAPHLHFTVYHYTPYIFTVFYTVSIHFIQTARILSIVQRMDCVSENALPLHTAQRINTLSQALHLLHTCIPKDSIPAYLHTYRYVGLVDSSLKFKFASYHINSYFLLIFVIEYISYHYVYHFSLWKRNLQKSVYCLHPLSSNHVVDMALQPSTSVLNI